MAQHGVPRDPPHRHAHPPPRVAVEAGLGPVGLVAHEDRVRGRRGQPQLLGQRGERRERLPQLRRLRRPTQLHAHGREVPVHHVHPVALGAHGERGGLRAAAVQPTEDLPRLALDLLFLVRDERHHVVRDVERRHAWIARAGQGLQRRHEHRLDAEARRERRQRQRDHHGRAVGIGDDEAVAAGVQQREMVRVHLGDEERHLLVHAVRRRVAEHRVARPREAGLDRARHVRRQAGEHHVAVERRLRLPHHQAARRGGHLSRQPPGTRLGVRPTLRAVGPRERRHRELRMVREQLDEPLAHGAGRAEDAHADSRHQPRLLDGPGRSRYVST